MRWSDKDKRKWHTWWAWHPIFLYNTVTKENVTIWMEKVARKRIDGNYYPYWIYDPDLSCVEKRDDT